ncbi:MAG TPA: hypothetical protein VIL30_16600, partial [Ramlibacter sp.]
DFRWTLTARPDGSKVTAGGDAAVLSWKPDLVGRYVFQLRVTDSSGAAATRSVAVEVDSRPPSASILVNATLTAAPTAIAPSSITIGANVVVIASRTTDVDGQKVSAAFELTARPRGSAAVLAVAARSARFRADVAGTYQLRVKGFDARGTSFESNHTFIADNRGANPVMVATVAETPATRIGSIDASVGYDVLLDAAGSADPDRDKLTRAWKLVTRPAGSAAALVGASGTSAVLSPDVLGSYLVRLTVTDSRGARSIFETTVRVNNRRPVAQVGTNASPQSLPSAVDERVPLGTQVTLRGDASADADGDALQHRWSLDARPSGSRAAPSSATAATPLFTPDREGVYVFRLRVTDPAGAFSERTLTLRVGTHAPVPVVDKDHLTALVGETVQASAALSFDEDGDRLSYAWSVDARPTGSTAGLAAPHAAVASFVPDLPGIYALAVRVSDGQSASFAYVMVRVLEQFDNSVALNFTPGVARYSHGLDRLVVASAAPNALRVVDPFTGNIATTVLPAVARNLALSPDGRLAVVVHDSVFSLVSLESNTVLRTTASGDAHTDAFVTNAGVVYLIGSSGGQWVVPHVVVFNGRTGARLSQFASHGNGTFYGTQFGVLAASLDKVFLLSQGLSPADVSYFTFAGGTVTGSGGAPYHGEHAMSAPLYLAGEETLLVTSAGTMFHTRDLTYAGRLGGLSSIAGFSHSSARQEALALQGGYSLPSVYRRFTGALLLPDSDLALPVVDGQQTYGAKIFHSANGSHVVLVQAGSAQPGAPGASHHVIVR